MATALAAVLLYTSCAAFFQASSRRTSLAVVRDSGAMRLGLRIAGWGLLFAALVLAAQPQGWERGTPVWLGLLMAAGGASLLLSALKPAWHAASGVAGGVAAVLLAIALIITGGGL